MAYNPFNIFRRNQKAIFAVITVIIMFMFVLSSGMTGKADLFNVIPDWFRGRSKGDALCTIDGDRIHPRDMEALRFQRTIAAKFMGNASLMTVAALEKPLIEASAQGSQEYTFFYQQMIRSLSQREIQGFIQIAGMLGNIKNDPASKDKLKPEDVRAMTIADTMAKLLQTGGRIAPLGNSDRDLVEFMLWQRKAKQLGIRYSADDAKHLVNKELLDAFKSDVEVRAALRTEYKDRYTDEMLFQALASEFEVRAAFSAIMGFSMGGDHTLNAPIASSSPYELYGFYREKTTPTSYELLRVPVEAFIPLVKETPSDAELERLFKSRESYEPDPSREEPGFREPRKIKVEWVSVTGEEPYYKKAAADYIARTELLAKSEVRGLIVPFPGAGIAAVVHIAAPAFMKEPLVYERYNRNVESFKNQISLFWTGPTTFVTHRDILETSIVKPQNLAAAFGGGAGGVGFGNPLLPVTTLYTASLAAEQKARIKAAMPVFLGAVPGPSMLPTMVASEAVFRKSVPEALPIDAVKPELLKELSESKARELAVADLKKLKDSIDKLTETGKARESAARDLVADFVRTRSVKTGASAEFQGEFTIGDDPGLAPLKAVLEKEKDHDPHTGMPSLGPIQFGRSFFWKQSFRGAKESAMGTYKPEFYPERAADNALFGLGVKTDPVFLAWRTADQTGRGSSFTEAKPRVIEAWKRIKARDLAKAEADRLAAEMRNKTGESQFLIQAQMTDLGFQLEIKTLDPKTKALIKNFTVANVAPLAITLGTGGAQFGRPPEPTIAPFILAPSANVPYPTADMSKQLLEERTKPVRTTFVLVDQPKDSYYVAVLADRRERDADDFKREVFGPRNQVGLQLNREERIAASIRMRDSVLALLKKEFKYEETEEQKKRLDDKQKGSFDE